MSYQELARVSCRYGAPMGRVERYPGPDIEPGTRFYLRTVPVDCGGYDRGGAYWGLGQTLYRAVSECGGVEIFFRAGSRADAKREVRAACEGAIFFR